MRLKMEMRGQDDIFYLIFLTSRKAQSEISRRHTMQHQQKQLHPQPVTAITAQPRGRPPLLLELDEKLIKFLRPVRAKGGVINIHVVRAATKALIESNPSTSQQLVKFYMPRSWVQSIYRRMGYTKRMGTTARPPVPRGLYDECRRAYLSDINKKIKKYNIPLSLCLILIKLLHLTFQWGEQQWLQVDQVLCQLRA